MAVSTHGFKSIAAQFTAKPALASRILWALIGEVIVPVAVAIVVWRFGASYTVEAFKWLVGAFTEVSDSWAWMLIPIAFSGIELAHWKLRSSMSPLVRRLAFIMTVVDLVSTFTGLFLTVRGYYLPSLEPKLVQLGIDAAKLNANYVALTAAAIASWWVTFSPERYMVNAVLQIVEIVKIFKAIVTGKVPTQ